MTIVKIIVGVAVIIVVLAAVAWLGTRLNVQSFTVPELASRNLGTVAPPTDLPAPVTRYVEAAFGAEIPLVESALVVGRADIIQNGISLPTRFKIYYDAGDAYYHDIEVLWFGQPVFTVNERFLNGVSTLDMLGSHSENDSKINAAANQGLWSEFIWLPSVWFTDERVHWEAVDNTTARLIIPNAAPEEQFTVRFDPQTGLMSELSTLRYQDANSVDRLVWTNRPIEWQAFNGVLVPTLATTQWGNDVPWATWHVEAVLYNVDVSRRMAQFGGEYRD